MVFTYSGNLGIATTTLAEHMVKNSLLKALHILLAIYITKPLQLRTYLANWQSQPPLLGTVTPQVVTALLLRLPL